MKVDRDAKIITLHQSDIGTFSTCPEQARRKWFTDLEDSTTDAAAIGTGSHSAYEYRLKALRDGLDPQSTAFLQQLACEAYDEIERTENLRYVQQKDAAASHELIRVCVENWVRDVQPKVLINEKLQLELHFDVHFMHYKGWEIRLAGFIDCVTANGIWDWKTANQAYKQWEKQRWAIQPTVYTAATVSLGLHEWPVTFKYAVAEKKKKNGEVEIIPVTRTAEHLEWLKAQVGALVDYWRHTPETSTWLMRDDHVLCSPKWCPVWADCKGAYLSEGSFMWKPTRP